MAKCKSVVPGNESGTLYEIDIYQHKHVINYEDDVQNFLFGLTDENTDNFTNFATISENAQLYRCAVLLLTPTDVDLV